MAKKWKYPEKSIEPVSNGLQRRRSYKVGRDAQGKPTVVEQQEVSVLVQFGEGQEGWAKADLSALTQADLQALDAIEAKLFPSALATAGIVEDTSQ